MVSNTTADDSTESDYVDKTPEGHRQQACQTMSGEVFSEYGVVDLESNFPSEGYEWMPEHPVDADVERHVVVPFRVVRRGIKTLRGAKSIAEEMNDGGNRYKAVLLSDMRGI